jgi:hypothetical protein
MIKTVILNSDATPKQIPATSRIFAFDVSGSMYGVLDKMKKHLKGKLFTQIPEGDDISIIYFSGRGQYGVIAEGINVSKVKDLKSLYEKIDTLQTIGLTGFLEPLKEVGELVNRLPKDTVKELFFLTDGYDNQWSEKEILAQCEKLRSAIDHAYLVEYGWYCNRALIAKMTEVLNATHLFSEDYVSYEAMAEKAVSEGLTKKVKVQLPESIKSNIAFYSYNNNIVSVIANEENQIVVPEDLAAYSYLPVSLGEDKLTPTTETYMALNVFAARRDSETVYALLKKLGDVRFVKQYVNAFGKQDLTKFVDQVAVAVFDEKERMSEGCDYNLVPSEDAYNVLEMLEDLMKEGNKLYPDHPDFQYKRIGRAKETVSVAERLEKTKEELVNTTDKEELKEKTEKMLALLSADDLKFEAKDNGQGIEISNLTWNEDRPNVSVLVRREGSVKLPSNKFNLDSMDTFIYRNYTIIKDGILNMNVLPVSLNKETFETLQKNGLLKDEAFDENKVYSLDFSSLPVINRKMVKTVSAKEVFSNQLKLEVIKGQNKVFKYYLNELEPKTSTGWKNQFGDEAVAWLAEMGLTEYNGFSPKVKSVESTDFYIGKSLEIKVKGLSSLPKVADVEKALKEGKKLAIKDLAMAEAIKDYNDFSLKLAEDKLEVEKQNSEKIKFLKEKMLSLKKQDKAIMLAMSKVKFATIIGQVWFVEFNQEEDSTMELDFLGIKATVSAELKDIEVKI